jgi:thymidylate kinase
MRRTLVVGLSGPDGAGKTTQARLLAERLGPDTGVLHLYGCFICRRLGPRSPSGDKAGRRTAVTAVHASVETLEHGLRLGLALALAQRAGGSALVVDRSPIDSLVKLNPGRGTAADRLVRLLLRRFDAVFLLDAPAELMAARDDEHSVADLERMREGFARVAGTVGRLTAVDATRPATEVADDIASRVRRGRRAAPHGLTVALVGPDGAGKTTLARAVAAELGRPARVVYMGIWRPGFLRHLGPAGSLVQLAYRPFKLWAYYALAMYHVSRGRVVVFERFVYDAYVPPRPPLIALKRAYLAGIVRMLPHPDLVLLLDVAGDEMHRRKGQHSRERLQLAADVLKSRLTELRWVEVVDAGRPFEEVKRDVLERIRGQLQPRRRSTADATSAAATGRDQEAGSRRR